MILTEEMIENLPVITDEELNEMCYAPGEFEREVLAEFDKDCARIDFEFLPKAQ
jgi:hypothetical protein